MQSIWDRNSSPAHNQTFSCMSGLSQYIASTASSGCCFTEQSLTIAGQDFQGHDLKISLNPGATACDIFSNVEETLFAKCKWNECSWSHTYYWLCIITLNVNCVQCLCMEALFSCPCSCFSIYCLKEIYWSSGIGFH